MNYAELGRRIRLARVEVLLSQEAVARHLELPRSAVSLIESGKRKVDSLELERFSRLVGKSILFFFDESFGIEKNVYQQLSKEKPKQLLAKIGRSDPRIEKVNQFSDEYTEMAFEAYRLEKISLSKLAELLEITLEEAKDELLERNIPVNLGVKSELELLSDLENT